jgi:hypothetical protein
MKPVTLDRRQDRLPYQFYRERHLLGDLNAEAFQTDYFARMVSQ